MGRARVGVVVGALGAIASIGACALDESGTASDGSVPDVTTDVGIDGGNPDVVQDVTYDIPDLGVFETESGLPCTCVPTPPTGYGFVEYVPDQRPSCTTGYNPAPKDFLENANGPPAQCGCSCVSTPSSAACSCGNNPATFDIASGNTTCGDAVNQPVMANVGTCYTTAQPLNPGGQKLNMMQASLGNTTCGPFGSCALPTKTQNVPDASVEQGRACDLDAGTTSCSGGNTCVPTQGNPFSMCVTNGTMDPCPNGFPIPHTAGTSTIDSRACSNTCGCSLVDAGSCGTPQLTLWEGDKNCGNTGSSVTMPVDNATCVNAGYGGGTTFNSARYSITHTGGACGLVGSSNPIGGYVLTGMFRVCCR